MLSVLQESKDGLSTCPWPQTWEAAAPGSTPEYSRYRATCVTIVLPPHLQEEQKQQRRGKVRAEEGVAFPGSPGRALRQGTRGADEYKRRKVTAVICKMPPLFPAQKEVGTSTQYKRTWWDREPLICAEKSWGCCWAEERRRCWETPKGLMGCTAL